jgi:hypothetical protein
MPGHPRGSVSGQPDRRHRLDDVDDRDNPRIKSGDGHDG